MRTDISVTGNVMSERYFLGLKGFKCIEDPLGFLFGSDLAVFHSAVVTRRYFGRPACAPWGTAGVIVPRKGSSEVNYVSVGGSVGVSAAGSSPNTAST